jgi:TonB family protein
MLEDFKKYRHGDSGEIQFLLVDHDPERPRRHRIAAAGAVLSEALLVLLVINIPAGSGLSERSIPIYGVDVLKSTPLVAPPNQEFKLTQKEPQRAKPQTEVNLAQLMPRPQVQPSPLPGEPGRPGTPQGGRLVPAPPSTAGKPLDVPNVDVSSPLPAGPTPQAPQIEPVEKPKLAFESVTAPKGPATGAPRLEMPNSSVDALAQAVARGQAPRGVVVGDAIGPAGVGEMRSQSAAPGRPGSQLELLSDPQGVDFRPYLTQVLAAVKRNWMTIMPESARFGTRGRTAVQFAIDRSGRVPKLVISAGSGVGALDRAAVAGISASTPFPPLPPEFRGVEIRLQMVFSYNMPR